MRNLCVIQEKHLGFTEFANRVLKLVVATLYGFLCYLHLDRELWLDCFLGSIQSCEGWWSCFCSETGWLAFEVQHQAMNIFHDHVHSFPNPLTSPDLQYSASAIFLEFQTSKESWAAPLRAMDCSFALISCNSVSYLQIMLCSCPFYQHFLTRFLTSKAD